jgi:hypothetical protein
MVAIIDGVSGATGVVDAAVYKILTLVDVPYHQSSI